MPLDVTKIKKVKTQEKAIAFKITNEEHDKFLAICKHYGISKTEALNQFILQEFDYLKEKGKIGD